MKGRRIFARVNPAEGERGGGNDKFKGISVDLNLVNSFFEALFLFGNKGKTVTNTFASEIGEARTVHRRTQ
jgi:hypothetical protein